MADATPASSFQIPAEFVALLPEAVDNGTFARLVLSMYRGKESELQRIDVRLVDIQDVPHASFVLHYKTRDITKNHLASEISNQVVEALSGGFRCANLFLADREVELRFSRKGKARMLTKKGLAHAPEDRTHNRTKNRLLSSNTPFLFELGVADKAGNILPSMSDKWKQINRFLELFDGAVGEAGLMERDAIQVVDFGSGKGYLTFAVHSRLTALASGKASVVGVELRPQLVDNSNAISKRLGLSGLSFFAGGIDGYDATPMDVLIALHACDTATDIALHAGVKANASVIMTSPCCHKELRPQIVPPTPLQPLLRFGIHLEKEAEMVTDSIRALLLEACGYEVKLFEFISTEHTAKNKMLLGIKQSKPGSRSRPLDELTRLKKFYGITHQTLEALLTESSLLPDHTAAETD